MKFSLNLLLSTSKPTQPYSRFNTPTSHNRTSWKKSRLVSMRMGLPLIYKLNRVVFINQSNDLLLPTQRILTLHNQSRPLKRDSFQWHLILALTLTPKKIMMLLSLLRLYFLYPSLLMLVNFGSLPKLDSTYTAYKNSPFKRPQRLSTTQPLASVLGHVHLI